MDIFTYTQRDRQKRLQTENDDILYVELNVTKEYKINRHISHTAYNHTRTQSRNITKFIATYQKTNGRHLLYQSDKLTNSTNQSHAFTSYIYFIPKAQRMRYAIS